MSDIAQSAADLGRPVLATRQVNMMIIGGNQWSQCLGSWVGQDGHSRRSCLLASQSSSYAYSGASIEAAPRAAGRANEITASAFALPKFCAGEFSNVSASENDRAPVANPTPHSLLSSKKQTHSPRLC